MGGRRKSNKIQKKEKPITIKTVFDCALCGFKNCIIVKIKKVIKMAELFCVKCKVNFTTKVRCMDEPIDVFHTWLKNLKNKQSIPLLVENRFEDQMSQPEGEDFGCTLSNNEEILKKRVEDSDIFSEDSLDEKKEAPASDSVKIESDLDSLLSDESESEPMPIKKVKA